MKTHLSKKFAIIPLLLALVGSSVQFTPAYAASIVVNTSADNYANDGKCTLREALDAANLNVRSGPASGECAAGSPTGVDTISFNRSLAEYVITVGSGGTSPKQLPYIITPIVIVGLGATKTVIQADAAPNNATWRLFQVTPAGNLTLDGVTVRNGQCNGSCTVEGNIEPDGGGGIYNSGTLTVMNSVISRNRGSLGGGIYNNGGILNVKNSTISDNNALMVTTDSDGGGGIRNSGTLTVTDSTISGNVAFGGGGIYNMGTLTVTNSTIKGNLVLDSDGGGIYNIGNGTATVKHSIFTGNSAHRDGGGISNLRTMIVTDSIISGNSAASFGGGLNNVGGIGVMTITNSTIAGNSAGIGGGINNSVTLAVTNSTISGNSALSPFGQTTGGGISNFDGSLTVTSSTISGNNGDQAGGISSEDSSFDGIDPTILRNTIVSGNMPANCVATNTTITDDGNNLDSGSTCGWGTSNGSLSNTDPQLGPLASNGGPTQTMKLLSGSPAIDAGNDMNCPATDQRGMKRPQGSHCDIGAYELRVKNAGSSTTGVFRPSNGVIYLKNTNLTGFADVALNYGIGGDYPVTGDWDGNGTATIGVYRNGSFLLRNSNTVGFADIQFAFGMPGDQPIAGDWDGDGDDTIGVYRSSTFTFYLRNSNSAGPADAVFSLGIPGDVGIAGDWTNTGFDTVGVFRPSNGVIFLKNTNQTGFADIAINYGIGGDKPVTGDWNGDGIDTIGVYRNGVFLLRNSNTIGFAEIQFGLGVPGDHPIAGNWDGLP